MIRALGFCRSAAQVRIALHPQLAHGLAQAVDARAGGVRRVPQIARLLLGLLQQSAGHFLAQLLAHPFDLRAHGLQRLLAVGRVDGLAQAGRQRLPGVHALRFQLGQPANDLLHVIDGAARHGADLALQVVKVHARALERFTQRPVRHLRQALALARGAGKRGTRHGLELRQVLAVQRQRPRGLHLGRAQFAAGAQPV